MHGPFNVSMPTHSAPSLQQIKRFSKATVTLEKNNGEGDVLYTIYVHIVWCKTRNPMFLFELMKFIVTSKLFTNAFRKAGYNDS